MGQLGQYFNDGGVDPSQYEPGNNDFTPLPTGWYPVEVESAEVKDTKSGGGKYLKLVLNVIGDEYSGRKLFVNLNILNASEKAQEIGRRELADLARACGIAFLDDEDMLLGRQLEVRVKVKQEDGRDPDNEVKGYRPLGGSEAAPPPAQQAPAQQQAPKQAPPAQQQQAPKQAPAKAAGGKMPWER